jgi:hypothetical protein
VKRPYFSGLTYEALDSMQYGYSPFVVKEACGDRHASVNDSNVRTTPSCTLRFLIKHTFISLVKSIHSSFKGIPNSQS